MESVIQRVFREEFGPLRRCQKQPLRVLKAAGAIRKCRTGALGGHVQRCPHGHVEQVWYNSCRHRSCPQCGWTHRERWVQRQLERLPDCDYFHVIFTQPNQLDPLWEHNRELYTSLQMRAGWETLREMLADPKHLGALPGALGGFHSWGQTLWVHPHSHFLATAGGLTPEGEWKPTRPGWMLPAKAVSAKFRGKLLAWLRRELELGRLVLPEGTDEPHWRNLFNKLGRKKWHVMVMPPYSHGRGVVRYLGRYLRGGPVGEHRIKCLENGQIQLRYKDNFAKPVKKGYVELSPQELLRRLCLHIPEPGQHLVRSYGVFAPGNGAKLDALREQLGQAPVEPAEDRHWQELWESLLPGPHPGRCPVCGEYLIQITFLGPRYSLPHAQGPDPPQESAA